MTEQTSTSTVEDVERAKWNAAREALGEAARAYRAALLAFENASNSYGREIEWNLGGFDHYVPLNSDDEPMGQYEKVVATRRLSSAEVRAKIARDTVYDGRDL